MESLRITTTIRIADKNYVSDPNPVILTQNISSISNSTTPLPVAVLNVNQDSKSITYSVLESTLASFLEQDDVISNEFLANVVILCTPGRTKDLVFKGVQPASITNILVHNLDSSNDITEGPYFLVGGRLHRVYRLFPDTYGAFISGVLPAGLEENSGYREAETGDIPVPSRLYFSKPTASLPLLGSRVVVKDIYDIQGLRTGGGSKAYLQLQEAAPKTAKAIQRLIDQGAVIIGKTKTSHMISGVAPRDWIDYQCPFNPRGDGYLDTDCSSSGSGAAIAGYEWVDIAIGSDSLGSMVGPASAGGTYGLRPTKGMLSDEGAVAVSKFLDTPGHFCRDVERFAQFAKCWIREPIQKPNGKFTKILVFQERFQQFHETEQQIMADFIGDMETAFNVKSENLDIETLWKNHDFESGFSGQSTSLTEYLDTTLATIQLYDAYKNNLPYQAQYKERFGCDPAIDPIVRYKWDLGSKITSSEYTDALSQRFYFRLFLEKAVVQEGTLLILPGGFPWVQYRDTYPGKLEEAGKPWQGYGFTNTSFSSLGKLPCVSFPVGQSTYQSKISGREEVKPVSLWMLSAHGTDVWLTETLAHAIKSSGRPGSVKVGKTAF